MTDDDFWPQMPNIQQIPSEFHSLELDGPFEKCLLCHRDLFEDECEYFVERIFQGTEPIVEYAMCMGCHAQMRSELSVESMQAIDKWLSEVDHEPRLLHLFRQRQAETIDPWLDRCIITGKRRDDCRNYQIIGMFRGPSLVLGHLPCMISSDALKIVNGLLSKQTRDRMDDFTGENFGMPPEFCEHPDFSPLLL